MSPPDRSKCLLVAAPGAHLDTSIAALERSGVIIIEIWIDRSQMPRNGLRKPTFLIRPSRARRSLYRALKRGYKLRVIDKPRATHLAEAMDEVGRFDFLLCDGSALIFPAAFLEKLPGPAVNLHPALLPHYKGPLPIHAMLMDGKLEHYGGVTLHQIEPGIDAGAIIAQKRIKPSDYDSFSSWANAVSTTSYDFIEEVLPAFLAGKVEPVPQAPGSGSYVSAKQVPLHIDPDQTTDHIERFLDRMRHMQR